MYKTLIWNILSYGGEEWRITSEEMSGLRVFEKKIVKDICRPVQEE